MERNDSILGGALLLTAANLLLRLISIAVSYTHLTLPTNSRV